jgi:hypothetical protein
MRAVLAAAAVGLVAGAVAAAAAQDDPTRAPARAMPPITEAPAREPLGRLPDGRYDPGYSHYLVKRVRIVATIEDPDGEPAWAIRTYLAERRTIKRPARTLDDYAFRQTYRCVELGRILNGRFGWVYGDRRFRPHEPTAIDQLTRCTSRRRPQAIEQRDTTLAFRSPSEPQLDQGVVWGLAPPGARSALVGTRRLDLHDGAFLGLVDPTLRTDRIRYGSEVNRLERVPRLRGRDGEPVAGSAQVEARAPDPAGGSGWGVLVADRVGGGYCVGGVTQLVGDRSGSIDTDLALFWASTTASVRCRPEGEGPTRRRPLWPGYGWGVDVAAAERDAFLRRARIERRVLPGRFEIVVECHPSVERVTIRSPRDIRTLVPSQRGHVVFALYDGDFSAGELVLTATIRGGGRSIERLPLGF